MAVRRRSRFLYLAIACFAGLVAIFIVDGYLGVYDTVYMTVGEYEQKIEADYWLRQGYEYAPVPVGSEGDGIVYCCIGANVDDNILFRYEIENHRFSTYSALIQASVWQENEKLIDLYSEDKPIGSFDEVAVEWTLSSEELGGTAPVAGETRQYTVIISHGDIERRIIVQFYSPYPYEPIPPKRI